MDNLTHTLMGAALGAAGLRARSPLAGPALLIGANLPDVDAFVYLYDQTAALALRRGWTHGILAMVLWPFILAGVLIACDAIANRMRNRPRRSVPFAPLLLVCAAAVWSHPLLDWLNTYGVRLLMPFSGRWFYGDTLFIVDPWLILLLGTGVWLARKRGAQPARAALTLALIYVACMWTLSAVTRGVAARAASAQGVTPVLRAIASPVPINSFARGTAVESTNAWHFGRVSWLPPRSVVANESSVSKNLELIERVRLHPEVQPFMIWSRAPFAELTPYAIEIGDARYAGPTGSWARVVIPLR